MYQPKAIKRYEEGRGHQQKGQLAAAERAYRKAIKIEAGFVEAYNNLGNVLLDRGRIGEASKAYDKALRLLPENPMLHNNLGNALLMLGKYEQACERLGRAIELDAGYADAHNNLGNALRNLGRLEDAADCYRRAIVHGDGRRAEVHSNLASVLAELGRDDEASAGFETAIEVDPQCREAHCGLGDIHRRAGRVEQAVAAYRQALRIDPDYPDASIGLGCALADNGDYAAATEALRRALRANPRDVAARNGLALVAYLQGDLAVAADRYRESLELDAGDETAIIGLGQVQSDLDDLETAAATLERAIAANPAADQAFRCLGKAYADHGEQDKAIATYRRAIESLPERAEYWRLLALNKRFARRDEDVARMQALYERGGMSDSQTMHLAFALAKVHEDLGDYESAITFMRRANRLRRASSGYMAEQTLALFDSIREVFSAEFFAARDSAGHPDPTPIFVVGMPRSGTSLVEQILASHAEVFGAGESRVLENLVGSKDSGRPREAGRFPHSVAELSAEELTALGAEYVARLRRPAPEVPRVTDKMPHNFLRIGLIRVILPRAKIVHCRRDPIDSCLSMFKNYFANGHYYSNDLADLGDYYRRYLELMAYWRTTLPGFVYDLDYEALIADQETETRKLLAFCGLRWDPACLRFHETSRAVKTASKAQVRRPIYADSVDLAKRYGEHLEPLRAALYD